MAEVLETQELFPVRRPPDRAPGNTLVGDAYLRRRRGYSVNPTPLGKGVCWGNSCVSLIVKYGTSVCLVGKSGPGL